MGILKGGIPGKDIDIVPAQLVLDDPAFLLDDLSHPGK